MPNTRRLQWPYPSDAQDPWFSAFESMVSAQDSTGYANREDRQLIITGGGSVSFDLGTSTVTWSADIEIVSPISGFKLVIAAGDADIAEGGCIYVNLTRAPVGNVALAMLSAGSVPNTDDAYVLAVRNDDIVYFRNGVLLEDGDSKPLVGGSTGIGSSANKLISSIWSGGRETHGSETPMIVGAFSLNPGDYAVAGTTMSISFRAVAANGDSGLTGHVKLVNVTDNDDIAILDFTSTSLAKDEVVLTIGAGTGEIDSSEKVYEVQIYLEDPPVDQADTIELYSAEVRVVNTIV